MSRRIKARSQEAAGTALKRAEAGWRYSPATDKGDEGLLVLLSLVVGGGAGLVTDLVSLGCCGCLLCSGEWWFGDCLARERAVDVSSVEVWSKAMGALVFLTR
ncbi:hypothetical protein NC653_040797 [Populus alba x Populus x berolinensis]|uniref:Uncharacterized protein n=2 Tax=Populus TaxID=3689 RepID=A0A4U5R2S1_POPAL|nr:hypothetical protein NC653_040797 [Populus alba x Populus x berolinensis]TKS18082.1 hypothetical protein D5086_0000007040 [Populus alba]